MTEEHDKQANPPSREKPGEEESWSLETTGDRATAPKPVSTQAIPHFESNVQMNRMKSAFSEKVKYREDRPVDTSKLMAGEGGNIARDREQSAMEDAFKQGQDERKKFNLSEIKKMLQDREK